MIDKKSFWVGLCLINLCIVAFLGVLLRSKIVFTMPFLDYRYLLSAHSHFAFGGWVGLSLIGLLIFELLPGHLYKKRIYLWILIGIEISALGMALLFPFRGYTAFSVFFSSLYIIVSFVFAWIFLKDILNSSINKITRLLSISAIASMVISSIGPLGLAYILLSHSGNSILYRDSIYTFLHFQYNGFFTLSIFALLFNRLIKQKILPRKTAYNFSLFLCLSVIPALFLALLWHNSIAFYILAVIACLFIFLSLINFFKLLRAVDWNNFFLHPLAKNLWFLAAISFCLKMILNIGTVFPQLGNAIYGNRPVIIGFLHLVFLGFVSFYILSSLIESGFFIKRGKLIRLPFFVFGFGIIANEALLMLQGLEILFKTNSMWYSWLLWFNSMVLFCGALLIVRSYYFCSPQVVINKNEVILPV